VVADFNGDGKADVLDLPRNGAQPALYLSTGSSFVKSGWSANIPAGWGNYYVVAGDFTGDGKADIALISQGSGSHQIWVSTGQFGSSDPGFVSASCASACGTGNQGDTAVVADWNNDGATDLWVQTTNNSDQELLTTYQPELMSSITNGLGGTISIKYQSLNTNGSFYQKTSGDGWPSQDVDGPLYVVSKVSTVGSGIPGRDWDYTYQGLVRDVTGRGMLGFKSIAVFDEEAHITTTTTYTAAFPVNGLPQTVVSAYSYGGQNVTLRQVSNTWYYTSSKSDSYCPDTTGIGEVVCLLNSTVSATDYDFSTSTSTPWPTVTAAYTYDAYGSILTKAVSYSGGGGAPFSSTTTNKYTTNNTDNVDFLTSSKTENVYAGSDLTRSYTFSPTATGQVQSAADQPGDSSELDVNYGYDNWGNVSSATYIDPNSSANGDTSPTRQWLYDYTDTPAGDNQGQFPYQITNPVNVNNPVTAVYYKSTGATSTLTDANGNETISTVDSFGRPTKIKRPDGTETDIAYSLCNPCIGNGAYIIVSTPELTSTQTQNGPQSIAYYDAYNRLVVLETQGVQQGISGGCWTEVDYTYDSLGYQSSVTRPYYNGFPSGVCSKDPPPAPTATIYSNDPLGRPVYVTNPNGREDYYERGALQTMATVDYSDPENQNLSEQTTTIRNDVGWVTEVLDAEGGELTYGYDAFGDPVTITPPKRSVVIQNVFDLRGRKKSTTDPDMGPNSASWTYTFDAFGELTAQQSPNEGTNQTTLSYDALGRLTSRIEPDMTSTWTYDHATNGIGLLSSAQCSSTGQSNVCVGGTYVRNYQYDSVSRPKSVSVYYGSGPCTQQLPCTSSETYDQTTQQLGTVTTFSGLAIQYSYNSTGYLSSITEGGANVWTMNSLDASLRIQNEALANSQATIERAYDPGTGNLASIDASGANNPNGLANLSYTWNPVGTLASRADSLNLFTDSFCYDNLNRLTSSNVVTQSESGSCSSGGQDVKTIAYDDGAARDGNITGKSDIGVYTYGGDGTNGAGPHAVTSIDTTAAEDGGCTLARCTVDGMSKPKFYYDNDGNMLCITTAHSCNQTAGRAYSWTSFDMASTLGTGSGVSATISYTPEHERGSLVAAASMYYLNNPAGADMEEMIAGAPNTWHTYVYAYGHIVAEFFNTTGGTVTPYYFVGDHLYSTTALSDPNGNTLEYDSYDAWGRRRNRDGTDQSTGCTLDPSPPSKTFRGFTGQEEMDAFCLINLNGRIYDPALGRMLSADPIVSAPMYGQAFDRYTYALNNPLSFTDPSGYSQCATCEPPPHCVDSCNQNAQQSDWQGGMCITCDYPAYSGWDAATYFVPGFMQGTSPGAGGGGNGAHMGSISGDEEADGSYDAPYSMNLDGPPDAGFNGYWKLDGVAVEEDGQTGPTNWSALFIQTGGFQDAAYFGQSYDQNNPNYHSYVHDDIICVQSPSCTVAKAFQGLLRFAAPGQTGVASTGNQVNVIVAGVSAGSVTQVVDPSTDSVYNITDAGHIFDPGYVDRSVVVDEAGGVNFVMVETVGEGVGNYPLFNEAAAGLTWTLEDLEIKQYVLTH
jgi:RHS repeat-associated protein